MKKIYKDFIPIGTYKKKINKESKKEVNVLLFIIVINIIFSIKCINIYKNKSVKVSNNVYETNKTSEVLNWINILESDIKEGEIINNKGQIIVEKGKINKFAELINIENIKFEEIGSAKLKVAGLKYD